MKRSTKRQVCDAIGRSLAHPTPRRNEIWEMVRALQALERGLDAAVQKRLRQRGLLLEAQRAQRSLHLMHEELGWLDTHRWGMLRIELCQHLQRAHEGADAALTVVEAARQEWAQSGAG